MPRVGVGPPPTGGLLLREMGVWVRQAQARSAVRGLPLRGIALGLRLMPVRLRMAPRVLMVALRRRDWLGLLVGLRLIGISYPLRPLGRAGAPLRGMRGR